MKAGKLPVVFVLTALLGAPIFVSSLGIHAAQAAASSYSESEIRSVETPEEAKIRQLREQEITQLRVTLGRRQPKNRQAEFYYRLAEIYLEGYHQTFLLEGRVHEKRLAHNQPSPVIDRAHSKPYLSLGIKACKEILATGIQYEHMDQVYYFLGFNYGELGEHKESIKYFAEIVRRFPSSPFVTEAYRELGDEAMDTLQFRKAQNAYEQSIQRASADVTPRLYHKLAWAYYRTKDFDRAISAMKTAIELSEKNGEKYLSLHDEALRDMAVFMTESGRVDEAIAYFQQVVPDPNYYPKVLERLGKQYERNVEPAKATQVYESLLKTNPNSEASFRVLVKLVDLDLRRNRDREALLRLQSAKIPSSPSEDDSRVALQNLRAMVRRTATEHHEKFRKHGDKDALLVAEAYYGLYLRKFLAQEDARNETPEIEMYLAEVDRELGKSKEASELYRTVVRSGDKRYAKEAAALWTASLAEAVHKSTAPKNSAEPFALEKEYVEAADDLQATLGDTVEGREAALKAAQILAGYSNTRSDSIKRIQKIIEKTPASPQANTAARLWLQLEVESPTAGSANIKETITTLRADSALMAADNDVGKGKLKAAISDQETRLQIATIAQEEKEKDFSSAAQGYETFARDAKDREVSEKAYANAVSAYLKGGDYAQAERVLGTWLGRFPRSARAIESFKGVATRALIMGKFDVASRLFEKSGTEGSDADSLETAARILEATGDIPRATADYLYHSQAFKNSSQHPVILMAMARLYEAQQMDREEVKAYRDCMSVSAEWEAECGFHLSELMERLKNTEESYSILRKIASQGAAYVTTNSRKGKTKPPPPAASAAKLSPYVGYARFMLADQLERSRHFDPLSLPDTKLKAGMNERIQFLEPLSRAYGSAVDAGGPWAIAALDRLARFAATFADDIDRIAPPAGLDAKGVAQFKKSLAAISGPLRRKAQDSWSDAYRKAVQAEVLSPAIPQMADHLADMGAAQPGRAQGFHGGFRLAGIAANGGELGADKAFEKTRERLTKNAQDATAWSDYGNLLWGAGRPLLAQIAYERASALDPRNTAALNNRGVTLITGQGASEEDWLHAAEALNIFSEVLRKDEFFVSAKLNRALLLNYYRIFEKARPALDQILVRNPLAEARDALAVADQGVGSPAQAATQFDQATDMGLKSSRFSNVFHRAARAKTAKDCLSALSDISDSDLNGYALFERQAVDDLKRSCTLWNNVKTDGS
jgi:tetratricopeptide (TPR) repeat protein